MGEFRIVWSPKQTGVDPGWWVGCSNNSLFIFTRTNRVLLGLLPIYAGVEVQDFISDLGQGYGGYHVSFVKF